MTAGRAWLVAVLGVLAAAGLLLLGAAGGALAAREDTPGDTSAEAGFARDMSVHHGQAVEMAMAVLPRTDDPVLESVARDIALTQQAQIGRMQGWLAEWGLSPTGSEPAMAWMAEAGVDHAGHTLLADGRMPGMASAEDVASLRTLPPGEAEVRFLQLMTTHHVAGVEMGEAGLELMTEDDPLLLADSIVTSQQGELEVLRELLAARGARPTEDTGDAGSHAGHEGHAG